MIAEESFSQNEAHAFLRLYNVCIFQLFSVLREFPMVLYHRHVGEGLKNIVATTVIRAMKKQITIILNAMVQRNGRFVGRGYTKTRFFVHVNKFIF